MRYCKQCGEWHDSDFFYKGQAKCKACVRARVTAHRNNNLERIRAYDRSRGRRGDSSVTRDYRKRNPEKYAATMYLNNAIRDGRAFKKPCEVCGTMDRLEAHHEDYSKPLEVRWFCSVHHKAHHAA